MAVLPTTQATTGPYYIIWTPQHYPTPRYMSKAERRLHDMLVALDGKRPKLEARLRREAHERKAVSDKRSRGRHQPTTTRRNDGRRMQTYEAAMAMRQLLR